MATSALTTLIDNLVFPECPRWHDGRLWFSDMHDRKVWASTEHGQAEVIVTMDDMPGGIGWLPDGRLLVVSMIERKLMRLDNDELVEVADLSSMAPFHCNDMVVDASGRAYIGNYGFDLDGGAAVETTTLVCVEPDGDAWVVVEGLMFPNGAVITDDNRTLIVAESFGQRLSAYTIAPDGSLADSRVWADLRPNVPDGICIDSSGALWVADPINCGVMRISEPTGTLEWIDTGRSSYACALGGSDGHTLFICTADSADLAETTEARTGRIETIRVNVPA
ncbi:MAG: SMP-30/gluconolactonase/LRE family protein [Actinomycetes bacterium]